MIHLQQLVPNKIISIRRLQPHCPAKHWFCYQSANSLLKSHDRPPHKSSCGSKRGRKGSVLVSAGQADRQSDCSARSEQPSNSAFVTSELDLLKPGLDPEVRNALPKNVPLGLCFEELRPGTNLLDVVLFKAQPSLAGLWQSAKTEAQNDFNYLGPLLAVSADAEAESVQTVAIFYFSRRLHGRYSDAGMCVDHYVLLCSCIEVC